MVIDSNVNKCEQKVALNIASYLLKCDHTPVVLCVGCDRVTGDSLAPIVGELLTRKYNLPAYVYGNMDYNVTAQNLHDTIGKVKSWHPHSPVIVVDAILGEADEIGLIKAYEGGCFPAGAYNKFTSKIGNYCVLGVVESKGVSRLTFLASVRLKIVTRLAQKIAKSVHLGFKYAHALQALSMDKNNSALGARH